MLKPLSTTLNSTAENFDTQPYFYTKSYGPLLFMVDLAGAKDPIGPSSLFHTCTWNSTVPILTNTSPKGCYGSCQVCNECMQPSILLPVLKGEFPILYLKSHWARFRLVTPAPKQPSTDLSYLFQDLAGTVRGLEKMLCQSRSQLSETGHLRGFHVRNNK